MQIVRTALDNPAQPQLFHFGYFLDRAIRMPEHKGPSLEAQTPKLPRTSKVRIRCCAWGMWKLTLSNALGTIFKDWNVNKGRNNGSKG